MLESPLDSGMQFLDVLILAFAADPRQQAAQLLHAPRDHRLRRVPRRGRRGHPGDERVREGEPRRRDDRHQRLPGAAHAAFASGSTTRDAMRLVATPPAHHARRRRGRARRDPRRRGDRHHRAAGPRRRPTSCGATARSATCSCSASPPEYQVVQDYRFESGRPLERLDLDQQRPVVVVGARHRRETVRERRARRPDDPHHRGSSSR